MGFDGKVILITGASSGIGADAARHLSKLGAKVSIVGRNKERLNEVADQIKNAGAPNPLAIVADVTKDTERIVTKTIKHFGQLDVLVNNAGFGFHDNISNVDISEFDRQFGTNVRSVIVLTKLCVPYLEKTKGNIVNMSSCAGLRAFPNLMTYCMGKGALDQFTKCLAIDLAPKGIRANSINPTVIRTPFLQQIEGSTERVVYFANAIRNMQLIDRIGEVTDTSAAIAFLADDKTASLITGLLLPIDGGIMTA